MSFTVRQISRTADGREIVRARTFEEAEIRVGRGTENDIHLPDLAIALHHAVIHQFAPNRIEVVATEGMPFDVDGRQVDRAEIDVSRGANVRMGSHLLAIAKGEGETAGQTVITVDRVGAISDSMDERDEARVFSLAHVLPAKRATAWSLVAVVLALFLIWPIWSFSSNQFDKPETMRARPVAFHSDESWSSGKLSLVHSTLQNNCQACHTEPFVAVKDESCVACHSTVHDHADPRRLMAAKPSPGLSRGVEIAAAGMFGIPEGRCTECHTEHEGATAMPVTQQKFCADCHSGLKEKLTDTKILDASDFSEGNHPQFRPAVRTSSFPRPIVQRVSLDARPIEDNGLKFPHALHLSKKGGVARMAQTMKVEQGYGDALVCADCHVSDPSGTRFVAVDMEKNCQACHSLAFETVGGTIRTLRHGSPDQVVADLRAFYRSTGPVQPINLGGMRRRPGDYAAVRTVADYRFASATRGGRAEAAIRAVFSQGGACFDCHKVVQPGVMSASFNVVPVRLPERYMRKGWFDHKAHDTESCQSCHAAETSNSAGDVLLPKLGQCMECHGGEASAKQVPSSCAMCHDYHMGPDMPFMGRTNRTRGKRLDQAKPMTTAGETESKGGA
jgi:predicted CXXCH cytochrome family protein